MILQPSHRLTTLLDLRYQQEYRADPGRPGEGSNRHGKTAQDVVVAVPVGTLIMDDESGEVLADLTAENQTYVAARGGRGGLGNAQFATSTNQTPTHCQPGQPGEKRWLRLELKLLADVGLVGLPNAGKSTLIAAVSAARPKIADYPFTTLIPNLGVVQWDEEHNFVVADIPGLIEGAHEGKGLGHQFLRHIERTSLLLYLVDISEWTTDDPVEAFLTLRRELETYDRTLKKRPFAIAATKLDIQGDGRRLDNLRAFCKKRRIRLFPISAATREGLHEVIRFLGKQVLALRQIRCASNY